MTTLADFLEIGKAANLSGQNLIDFAKDELKQAKEERALERSAQKELLECQRAAAEAESIRLEKEAIRLETEAKLVKGRADADAIRFEAETKLLKEKTDSEAKLIKERADAEVKLFKEKTEAESQLLKERTTAEKERDDRQSQMKKEEMAFQLTDKDKDIERIKAEGDALIRGRDKEAQNSGSSCENKDKYRPKLPFLSPNECLFNYLTRFEDAMVSGCVPEGQWISRLRDLLTGTVLRTFQDLSTDDKKSFTTVRERLLASQNLGAEGYRKKFLDARPTSNTSFGDYVTNVKSILGRWLLLSKVNTFDQLVDLTVKNKVLETCNAQIGAFILERDLSSVEDIFKFGDQYTAAHPEIRIQKEPTFTPFPANTATTQIHHQTPQQSRRTNIRHGAQKRSTSEFKDRRTQYSPGERKTPQANQRMGCFFCGSWRHKSMDCSYKTNRPDDNDRSKDRNNHTNKPNSGCFLCGGPHIKRYCPRASHVHANNCNVKQASFKGHKMEVLVKPVVTYPAISELPEPLDIKLHRGFVNDKQVTVMVDSGANVIGVHRDLVTNESYTGRYCKCTTFSGRVENYPLARVHIRSPFFQGWAEVCVLRKPAAQLILGQVTKLTPRTDEEIQNWYAQEGIRSANAVTTRAQQKEHNECVAAERSLPIIMEEVGTEQVTETQNNKEIMVSSQPIESNQSQGMVVDQEESNATTTDTIHHTQFQQEQQRDSTLTNCYKMAKEGNFRHAKNGRWQFFVKNGTLFRYFASKLRSFKQVVVPVKYRTQVLSTSHDSMFAGHMGTAKTLSRVQAYFYWPGITNDVRKYCQSCKICQQMIRKGTVRPAPIQESYLPYRPFEKVSVDIVGPLPIASQSGYRYILTMMDLCTRWPEAVPLRYLTAQEVAEALFSIFCRLGFPETILSDHGTQFVSRTMRSFTDLLSIGQTFSSIYHPMSNGVIENFHKHLKSMLAKVTSEYPKEWDKYLPAVLFAYREVPQRSTQLSPYEILFGTQARGPLSLLYDLWVCPDTIDNKQTYSTFLSDVRNRIITGCRIARENLTEAGEVLRDYANKSRKLVSYKPGEQVFVLLPDGSDKLLTSWQGPFTITKKISDVDYVVDIRDHQKVLHVNMLKIYTPRTEYISSCSVQNNTRIKPIQSEWETDQQEDTLFYQLFDEKETTEDEVEEEEDVGFDIPFDQEAEDDNFMHTASSCVSLIDDTDESVDGFQQGLPLPSTLQTETWEDVNISDDIPSGFRDKFKRLLYQYSDVLTDVPGQTTEAVHTIKLSDTTPIRISPYKLPLHYEGKINDELTELLRLGIIEPSESPYSFPLVGVLKKDATIRICVDFRKLNRVTINDVEMMPNIEDIFAKLPKAKFFTKIDLTKGYWQIPLDEESKKYTSFQSPLGQMQWRFMTFGLCGAPFTFTRLIRKLTDGRRDTVYYLDDILLFHATLDEQWTGLRDMLERLRTFGLTARPSKVYVAFREVTFLGFNIGNGWTRPEKSMVTKILNIPVPKTKKQVRSIIGLVNFYSRFIPNYSGIVSVLCKLTQKDAPDKVVWTSCHQNAIRQIQSFFNGSSFLRLPDISKRFFLFSDSSLVSVAAVLCQEHEGNLFPCFYASRRLTAAEVNYPILQLEAMAILFGLQRFSRYLMGANFTVCTDSKCLSILRSTNVPKSKRLMRWCLLLENFDFDIVHVPGHQNILSDFLSRN